MKYFGKRVLASALALCITVSMTLTNMSAMQVYAAGNTEYAKEESAIELTTEVTEESTAELETEVLPLEQPSEEEDVTEAPSEEVSPEEKDLPEATEEMTDETVAEEPVTEEVSVEEPEKMEETIADTMSEDEIFAGNEEGTDAIFPLGAMGVNNGFTFSADEDGILVVEYEDGTSEISGIVEIPKEVKIIPAGIFTNKIFVTKVSFEEGSELNTIEENAFFGSSITTLTLPKSLQSIEKMAFHSSELKELVFEKGGEPVTIGELAFAKNYNLKEVVTNGRLKDIGESAFLSDRRIEETINLAGVNSIGSKAFYGCEALEYIAIPDTVEVIGESAFEGCISLGKHDTAFYRGVNAVQFGNGVREIQNAAFKGCSGLQEVIIPANVEKLGQEAFAECTSLKNIKIYNVSGSDATNACAIELAYTSFPSLKGLVLEAYDGKVEDWVGDHAEHGVTFKSLYKSYEIQIAKLEKGTITANKTKAKMGAIVTLTVTPEKEYVLEYGSLYYAYKDAPTVPVKQINTWDYSFTMPQKDIVIYATFVKEDSLDYGTGLTLAQEDLYNKTNESIFYNEQDKVLTFAKPWQNVRIEVKGSNGRAPLCNQLVFSSNNTSAVTVDEKGNIRALAPTTNTKITVKFKDENNKTKPLTFTVKVGSKTSVSDIALAYKADKAEIDTVLGGSWEAAEAECDIITYPASLLNVKARTIQVIPTGKDSQGDILDVEYKLTSLDAGIAKPAAATFVGSGTVTIPKGVMGETVVTVQANDGSKKPAKKQFIIRIIDDTPRLVKSTLKVDPQSTQGTFVDLVSVYGESPDIDKLAVYQKVVRKGNTVYEPASDLFKVSTVSGKIYLKALENEDIKYESGKEYKFEDTYYIGGILEGSVADFYVPIPTLIVCKKDIKPTITMTGKINLFYNGTASLDKTGKVTVKQSQKDLVIEECYLVGKEKTNGVNTNDDSAFTENFTTLFDEEKQTIRIIRTPGDEKLSCYTAGTSKGKPVLTGKIRIKYEGYTKPFDIKITVPTETVKPTYKLSLSQIKLNSLATGQEYDVSFINKATKKVEDLVPGETTVKLDITDSGTTMGLIDEPEEELDFDAESDTVNLKIATPKTGKIVLVISQPDWEERSEWNAKSIVKATVKVSASAKYPKAVLDKTTLTLNAACPAASDYTVMRLNQADAELAETQTFVATGNTISEYISVYYDGDTGKVIAEIEEGATVKKGTYRFTCTPEFVFKAGDGNALKRKAEKITVKVNVKDAAPYIKLNKTSFTLNANCNMVDESLKYDYATTGYKWSNLPAEYSDYTLSDEYRITYTGKGTDYIGAEWIQLEVDEDAGIIKIYVDAPQKVVGSGNYKAEGLKLIKDNIEIPLKPISFKLKCADKTPQVSVTAKGAINPLDPTSKIVYTTKLSGINGTILDVELREVAGNGSLLPVEETHFVAEHDPQTGKTTVKVKEPEVDPLTGEVLSRVQLENRTYRIQLYYELSNGNGEEGNNRVPGTYRVAKDQKITPKQTMPTLKVDKKSATFYAGDKSRTQTFTVTKKSTNAQITNVKFSTKTPSTLRNAFYIESYNSETGKMVLRLKNSAFIMQNTEQTLTFEIECDGQMKDTVGTTFEVKVKVIK